MMLTKKLLWALLMSTLVLSMAACSKGNKHDDEDTDTSDTEYTDSDADSDADADADADADSDSDSDALAICGDKVVNSSEQCDDGNTVNTDACVGCQLARCGDGFIQAGTEECEGETATCSACKIVANVECGNGVQDTNEACDDGNNNDNDGCVNCELAFCGDSHVNAAEEACDDQNSINTDGCINCVAATCGDGFIQAGVETCDDGDEIDTNDCNNKCGPITCGDGIVQAPEACDDKNSDNTDDCLSSCVAASCGDGNVRVGANAEACDDGDNNSETGSCLPGCILNVCGDGFKGPNEGCDDGAANGANAPCSLECVAGTCGDGIQQPSEECDDGDNDNTDECLVGCLLPSCGDGFLQTGEGCDNGPDNAVGAACDPNCIPATCGDGVIQAPETCDDGDGVNAETAHCLLTCQIASCGDGFVEAEVEQCDDRNSMSTDSCISCVSAYCGDGYVLAGDGGEQCDLGGDNGATSSCLPTCLNNVCGDGFKGPDEGCDDGAENGPNAACGTDCVPASCGDSVVQAPETCDDGNEVNEDACLNNCQLAICGDLVRRTDLAVGAVGYEGCDDGKNGINTDACLDTCLTNICGDGFQLGGTEECDDGNTANGDGCSSDCLLTDCGDGILDSGEECDDGLCDNNGDTACNRVTSRCLPTCLWNVCGDDVICLSANCGTGGSDAEQCDDGAENADTSRCKADCTANRCGDGDTCTADNCDVDFVLEEPMCENSCTTGEGNAVGRCDDGGDMSATENCDFGTDCADCGVRPPGEIVVMLATGMEECDDANADKTDACIISDYTPSILNLPIYSATEDNCVAARCGDGYIRQGTEQCDDGIQEGVSDELYNTNTGRCLETCVNASCHDGFLRTDLGSTEVGYEECDDGNTTNTDGCVGTCDLARCGDTYLWTDIEGCDDGNTQMGDTCGSTLTGNPCAVTTCGNGSVQTGEACDTPLADLDDDGYVDDSQNSDTGYCTTACKEARCGDRKVCSNSTVVIVGSEERTCAYSTFLGGEEECDDADGSDNNECVDATCKLATCGDGYACTAPDCNDEEGTRAGDPGIEQCDDGNRVNTDECVITNPGGAVVDGRTSPLHGNCSIATCGDGFTLASSEAPEACDDGNTEDRDDCVVNMRVTDDVEDGCVLGTEEACYVCRAARCGDGYVHLYTKMTPGVGALEGCDDGDADNTDACRNDCVTGSCGNGILDRFDQNGEGDWYDRDQNGTPGTEDSDECDDANSSNTDGCLNNCVAARCGDGFVCAGASCATTGVTHSEEPCDDGNNNNNDDCVIETSSGVTSVGALVNGNPSVAFNCQVAVCGDGFVRTAPATPADAEECDEPGSIFCNTSTATACDRVCPTTASGMHCDYFTAPVGQCTIDNSPDGTGDNGTNSDLVLNAGLYPTTGVPERCYMQVGDQNAYWTYLDARMYCEALVHESFVFEDMNEIAPLYDDVLITAQHLDNNWGGIVDGALSIGTRLASPLDATQNGWVLDMVSTYAGSNTWIGYPPVDSDYANWLTTAPGEGQDVTFMVEASANAGRWGTEDDNAPNKPSICEYIWPTTDRSTDFLPE